MGESATGRDLVIRQLESRREELVDQTFKRICADIPAYGAVRDPELMADVRQHVDAHHSALLESLAANRSPIPDDFLLMRQHTARRVGRIPVTDYMRAFRIFQVVIWDALVDQARDEDACRTILTLVGPLLDYINVAAAVAAEQYIEIEQFELAGGERVRRDLLEDLVAVRPVPPGPRQDAARDAGLGPDIPCLVAVGLISDLPDDEESRRSVAAALARACVGRLRPLTVMRRDEIVVVAPADGFRPAGAVAGFHEVHQRLSERGLRMALGVSTVHAGLAGVASAHREARSAAECLGPDGGVLALPDLSAFDYLSSFRDATAERLIPPEIKRFVEDDLAHGGVLTTTLLAYVESDLNVKALSERLFVHTNTAHYRLNRITEQTRRDLRKLSDVLELVIAIRLAHALGDRPPAAWS